MQTQVPTVVEAVVVLAELVIMELVVEIPFMVVQDIIMQMK